MSEIDTSREAVEEIVRAAQGDNTKRGFGIAVSTLSHKLKTLAGERDGWKAAVEVVKAEREAAHARLREEQALRFGALAQVCALRDAADYVRRDLKMRADMKAGRTGKEPVVAIGNGAWVRLVNVLDSTREAAEEHEARLKDEGWTAGLRAAAKYHEELAAEARKAVESLDRAENLTDGEKDDLTERWTQDADRHDRLADFFRAMAGESGSRGAERPFSDRARDALGRLFAAFGTIPADQWTDERRAAMADAADLLGIEADPEDQAHG